MKSLPKGEKSFEFLGNFHKHIVERLDDFLTALSGMRYDSKEFYPENVQRIQSVLGYFENDLKPHIQSDEEIIFPYIEDHIPRLASVLTLLRAEHAEFLSSLKNFRFTFDNLLRTENQKNRLVLLGQVAEIGLYLIYLMRTHLRAEEEAVYRVMARELKVTEKNNLMKLLQAHKGSYRAANVGEI